MKLERFTGLIIGMTVFFLWLGVLLLSLTVGWSWSLELKAVVILFLTFLNTGLFIQAHDCMHGSLISNHPRFNDFLGIVLVHCYAMFDYQQLKREHFRHHQNPGVIGLDPDFEHIAHSSFLRWYKDFMLSYLSFRQLFKMTFLFWALVYFFDWKPVVTFWALPAILSTFQLFYFGTYLPHKPGQDLHPLHRARSTGLHAMFSFFTCYHFGIHLEHHLFPHVPWWKLPSVRSLK